MYYPDLGNTIFDIGDGNSDLIVSVGIIDGAINRINDPKRAFKVVHCKVGEILRRESGARDNCE